MLLVGVGRRCVAMAMGLGGKSGVARALQCTMWLICAVSAICGMVVRGLGVGGGGEAEWDFA